VHGVRLRVAYDGSELAGWQRQPGLRTVQGELEAAASALLGVPIEVRGVSRTDAGVHAEDQIVAFDSPRELPPQGWVRGLNGKLADDIAVRIAEPCEVGYRPRFDAVAKTYRYVLHLGAVRDPRWRRFVWHLGPRRARPWRGAPPSRPEDWLDLDAMEQAAGCLVGEHDFRAFRAAGDERESSVRTLTHVRLERGHAGREDLVAIEVRGTAFLQHMVRILVGTLVDVGRERMTPDDVAALLGEHGRRERAGETAPPSGLTLARVELGRSSGAGAIGGEG
jgi:tRNA pseudouridine38-40 synthase